MAITHLPSGRGTGDLVNKFGHVRGGRDWDQGGRVSLESGDDGSLCRKIRVVVGVIKIKKFEQFQNF